MEDCKLAIIIPSWNCSKYIRNTLDCIIANTFQDWICYIVDDNSTDNSLKIIKSYHEIDKRIKYYIRDREPKGAQTCRNIGFELSKNTEYVIWFDADDIIAPFCFEQRVNYMEKHPELDFAVFPAKSFKYDIYEQECMLFGFPFFDDSLRAMLHWTLPMVGWTNIYRRSSLELRNIKWDERLLSLQDSDFNISALRNNLKHDFAYNDNAKIDYFYRSGNSNDNKISKNIKSEKHLLSHLILINKILNSFTREQWKMYKDDLEINAYLFAQMFVNNSVIYNKFLSLPIFHKHLFLLYSLTIFKKLHSKGRLCTLFMMKRLRRNSDKYYMDWINIIKKTSLMIKYD